MISGWILSAFVSMFFAGCTSVIAKKGLEGVSGDLGLTVRTCFVFVFTLLFASFVVPIKVWSTLKTSNWIWLGASAVTTTLSWIFYYRALKLGDVATVALIDKGSVIVAVILAAIVFHESLSLTKCLGAALIVAGLVVVSR